MAKCISPIMPRRGQFVPCGKCNFCLQNKRADWTFRLKEELKVSSSAFFLTLTYSEENLPYSMLSHLPELNKSDVQLFTKRLRTYESKNYSNPVSLRYYTVGEYGTRTNRPHYHSIMFNMQLSTAAALPELWAKGHVDVGSVTGASIHYVTKYCITKNSVADERTRPFALISNRSGGLGKNFLINADSIKRRKETVIRSGDGLQRLPRYYKDKIFTGTLERERLSERSLEEARRAEADELARMEKLHPDAFNYIVERERYNHELISKQVSKNEKL